MSLEAVRAAFGWSAIINLAILSVWFLVFVAAHSSIYRLHHLWFQLSREAFDAIHYAGMAWYKLSIWLFFITPYLALRLFL